MLSLLFCSRAKALQAAVVVVALLLCALRIPLLVRIRSSTFEWHFRDLRKKAWSLLSYQTSKTFSKFDLNSLKKYIPSSCQCQHIIKDIQTCSRPESSIVSTCYLPVASSRDQCLDRSVKKFIIIFNEVVVIGDLKSESRS